MAVYTCSGCGLLISFSVIPGGNPETKSNPDSWAQSWRICSSGCGIFCDRCADPTTSAACPKCDGVLEEPTEETIFSMMFPQQRIETEDDLPHYVRRAATGEERIRRLDRHRDKVGLVDFEYEAFMRIIDGADYEPPEPNQGEQDAADQLPARGESKAS